MNTNPTIGLLKGVSLIGTPTPRDPQSQPARRFSGVDPRTGESIGPEYLAANSAEVAEAGVSAADAFRVYSRLPGSARAAFLRLIAQRLEDVRGPLTSRAIQETGLPMARLEGELTRTTHQLILFAELIEDDAWRGPRIDAGDAHRTPTPKPDVRSMRRSIGPVVVFGASNFPLAFSVAGGDTAAALAAGCPVIVKAHPGHPGTSEIAGRAITEAAAALALPVGVFALLFDDGHSVGQQLVALPEVKAVAFTGSRRGGTALMKLASERQEPIPVYAEMGSVNPIFVLPDAAELRGDEIAEGVYGSFMLGVGQFCTSPGVVLVPQNEAGDRIVRRLTELTNTTEGGTMLNEQVCANYGFALEALRRAGGRLLARGHDVDAATAGVAALWEVAVEDTLRDPALLAEVFGPSAMVVRYSNEDDLLMFAKNMEGQLTCTLQAQTDELIGHRELVDVLADRAGRLIVNQYPTGVEVGPAMVHGGPFPATSDGRSTSVGTRAIERFTRLVAYQNFPEGLLPEALWGSGSDVIR